jgi:hypothetical protein
MLESLPAPFSFLFFPNSSQSNKLPPIASPPHLLALSAYNEEFEYFADAHTALTDGSET